MKPSTAGRIRTQFFRHVLLAAAAIVMLYPLLWMIASSFKPESQIFSNPTALPTAFDLSNYLSLIHI